MTREQKLVEAYDFLCDARNRRLQAEAEQKVARKAMSDADREFWSASAAEQAAMDTLLGVGP